MENTLSEMTGARHIDKSSSEKVKDLEIMIAGREAEVATLLANIAESYNVSVPEDEKDFYFFTCQLGHIAIVNQQGHEKCNLLRDALRDILK